VSRAINDAIAACSQTPVAAPCLFRRAPICAAAFIWPAMSISRSIPARPSSARSRTAKAYDHEEPFDGKPYQDEGHTYFHNSLIWGENLTNVSITGRGTINGGGLVAHTDGDHGNKSIALKNCNNVLIRDITIAHGGWFAILATGCNLLTDRQSHHRHQSRWHRSGLLPEHHRFQLPGELAHDDAIVPKSTLALGYPVITENMTITNCQVSGYREGTLLDGSMKGNKGGTGRIKFGTESTGGFRNITVSNCTFNHCRGLAIEEVDGGTLENFTISNLSMNHVVDYPIFIRLGDRHRGSPPASESVLKNVLITDVIATGIEHERHPDHRLGRPSHPRRSPAKHPHDFQRSRQPQGCLPQSARAGERLSRTFELRRDAGLRPVRKTRQRSRNQRCSL
jgi:hypothetical protein